MILESNFLFFQVHNHHCPNCGAFLKSEKRELGKGKFCAIVTLLVFQGFFIFVIIPWILLKYYRLI